MTQTSSIGIFILLGLMIFLLGSLIGFLFGFSVSINIPCDDNSDLLEICDKEHLEHIQTRNNLINEIYSLEMKVDDYHNCLFNGVCPSEWDCFEENGECKVK